MRKEKLGIYVHIPFCLQKCKYCDFTSYSTDESQWDRYIQKLALEIEFRSQFLLYKEVDTIFFGGGTPSLLGPDRLAVILQKIRECFVVDPEAEITLEVNPETVDLADWQGYQAAGFTRASIGVQSLNDQELLECGRIHSADEARKAVQEAREAGFIHLNVDLMYGLPGQSLSSFQGTLKEVASWPVDHLSVYGLQIEEGTPFYKLEEQGLLSLPEPGEEGEMYDWLQEFLPNEGFDRYEISNFCRSGGECRHNLKYWRYQPYLGFGVSACGFDGEQRQTNPDSLRDYFEWIESFDSEKLITSTIEELSLEIRQAEFCFMGLRTKEGISSTEFLLRFGTSIEEKYGKNIGIAIDKGWLEKSGDRYIPTPLGFKFNNLLGELFLPDSDSI